MWLHGEALMVLCQVRKTELHSIPLPVLQLHKNYASGQRLEGNLEKSDLWDKLIYGTVG